MKKYCGIICCLLGIALVSGCAVYTRPVPPPARVEVRPRASHAQAVWVPGHWQWKRWGRRYVWVPGHWVVKKPGRAPRKVIIVR